MLEKDKKTPRRLSISQREYQVLLERKGVQAIKQIPVPAGYEFKRKLAGYLEFASFSRVPIFIPYINLRSQVAYCRDRAKNGRLVHIGSVDIKRFSQITDREIQDNGFNSYMDMWLNKYYFERKYMVLKRLDAWVYLINIREATEKELSEYKIPIIKNKGRKVKNENKRQVCYRKRIVENGVKKYVYKKRKTPKGTGFAEKSDV